MAKQVKEIKISGLSSSPSDYANSDGNLSFALGTVHENDSIEPFHVSSPSKVLDLTSISFSVGGSGHALTSTTNKVVLIHKTSTFNHAIVESFVNDRYWYSVIDLDTTFIGHVPSGNILTSESSRYNTVTAIGNTIIAYSDTESFYFLADSLTKQYKFLGNSLPDVSVSFRLVPHSHLNSMKPDTTNGFEMVCDSEFKAYMYTFKRYAYGDGASESEGADEAQEVTEENSATVTDAVMGQINKFVGGWANSNGYFTQPFFVRYAIRLYDGTLTKHSAPILMVPASGCNPFVFTRYQNNSVTGLDTIGIGCELRYKIEASNIEDWKDIVSSIDFFVSNQFYPYDQSGKVEHFNYPILDRNDNNRIYIRHKASDDLGAAYSMSVDNDLFSQLGALKLDGQYDINLGADLKRIDSDRFIKDDNEKSIGFGIVGNSGCWYIGNLSNTAFNPHSYPVIPMLGKEEYMKSISDCSTFYHIKSVELNGISAEEEAFDLKDKLNTIVTRELMTDEFESHHKTIPSHSAVYNGRLNIANIKVVPFGGFGLDNILPKSDEDTFFVSSFDVFYIIRKGGTEFVTHSHYDYKTDMRYPVQYLYYPDADAKIQLPQ